VDQRTAFRRASETLEHHTGIVWLARSCAIGAGLMTAALLAVLALYVDLLISQGRIPAYSELSAANRQAFAAKLPGMTMEQRQSALAAVGVSADDAQNLTGTLEQTPAMGRERLWRAYVWKMLHDRVGADAATTYANFVKPLDPAAAASVPGMGSLSLVVRTDGQLLHRFAGWMASWNGWSWRPGSASIPNYWYMTGLLYLAIMFALIRTLLIHLMNRSAATAALEISTRLRRAIYHHTYRLGTLTIQSSGLNRAASLFHRHVDAVADAVHERLSSQFFCATEVVILLAFALAIHVWLAIAFLLMAVIVLLIGGQLMTSYRRTTRNAERRGEARMALMQESIAMMRLVKGHAMELFNQSRVERQLADFADAQARRIRGESLFRPVLWFLVAMASAVLLYIAGLTVLSRGLGAANVILLAATILCAYWPIRTWLKHRRIVRHGRDSAVLIYEFLDQPREVGQAVGAEFLTGIESGVELSDVTLRDPSSGRVLLDGVTMSIGAGERVGLIGPNDAEKLAVAYLLARFLDPTSGEILIDDKNLKWLTLESLRNQVGLVLQSSMVFSDSVAHNIGCGDPGYTIPQIIEAAKISHAHQFIQRLPYGYETPLGEIGTSLRPGEQFRIALARAILRDPAMYVIEEPAVPLDDEIKELLDDTFERILPGKTVLFLPHRISTIRTCDRLYLLNNGRVEAVGDHRELINGNDLYKHLHYLEFNEFAEKV
jgi:ATP-binding cassette subfamily B protein